MQIDRYNHLSFPRDANTGSNPAAAGKHGAPSTAVGGGALAKPLTKLAPAPVAAAPMGPSEGVVLKIQWPGGAQGAAKAADAAVYGPGRRIATGDGADTGATARVHQLAVGNSAGIVTQISLKDGVLIARPHPVAPDKQPDFVALAVSAMREYSDEHDRQKVRPAPEAATVPTAVPAQTPWSAIKGLQQIAAKLNVFA